MVMPVMTKMYRLTGDRRYLDKMVAYFDYANDLMYDADAHLYFRDARYVYPQHKSVNGKKDFWARGDGWVFAALAKVLADLPRDDPYRPRFEERFRAMAQALKAIQSPDGYWTRSLVDPAHAPGPERAAPRFFTYGMLWGINNGLLDRDLPAGRRERLGLPDAHRDPGGRQGGLRAADRRPRDPRPGRRPRFDGAFRRRRRAAGGGRDGEARPLILSFAGTRPRSACPATAGFFLIRGQRRMPVT